MRGLHVQDVLTPSDTSLERSSARSISTVMCDWSNVARLEMECPHNGPVGVSGDTGVDLGTGAALHAGRMSLSPAPSVDANFTADRRRGGATCSMLNNPHNMMPNDLAKEQVPGLSPQRVDSSIPRAEAERGSNWVYPSPQMFYNAMQRKGHAPQVQDMDVIVAIHNIVNEQTWQAVLKWERRLHPGSQPKLQRFLGRKDALSPRARLRTLFLGCRPPYLLDGLIM